MIHHTLSIYYNKKVFYIFDDRIVTTNPTETGNGGNNIHTKTLGIKQFKRIKTRLQ